LNVLIWMINFFSLFSSFGALVVLGYIGIRSRRMAVWAFFAVLLIYAASYASGILSLIIRTGLSVPLMENIEVIPRAPRAGYFLQSLIYFLLFPLTVFTVHGFLAVRGPRDWLILLPFVLAGLILPDFLFLFSRETLNAHAGLFIFFKLLSMRVLQAYPMVMLLLRRDRLSERLRRGVTIAALFSVVILIPLMAGEDLLTLAGRIRPWNVVEALGFLFLMTAVLIFGIYVVAAPGKSAGSPVSLSDLSAESALTGREEEVLKELLAGGSYKEIGGRLHISPETVKTHVSRIYRKTGVSSRQELKFKYRKVIL